MTALKEIYKNGFAVNQPQDAITTIPLPVDILHSIQSPQGQNVEDFNWWDSTNKPSILKGGSAVFKGDINYPTHTDTVTTVRIEATSYNPLLRGAVESWFSMSCYTPVGYIADPKHEVIQQWHSLGGSPSFSINRRNGFYRIHIFTASDSTKIQVFGVGPCVPGEWVHFIARVVWADDLTGRLTVWKNGRIARLNNPSGVPWVVPNLGDVGGISNDWPLKAELGDLPYTVFEGGQEVSILDWYGKTSREGDGASLNKYFKCGIYKSGITNSYFPGGGLRPGWDDPDSEYYIPPESRNPEISIGNVNFETRVEEFSHLEIYKSLDTDGESPLEVPEWWVWTEYDISVTVNGSGSVTGDGTYNEEDEVTLTATPAAGWLFDYWEDADGTYNDNPLVFVATADRELTAYFVEEPPEPTQYTLTVGVSPIGGGTTNQTSVTHISGETIPLVATPSSDYVFVNWTKGATVLSTNASFNYTGGSADETVVANFAKKQFTVSLTAGTGGSVSGGGVYEINDVAVVTATPDAGYAFTKWSDNNTDNPRNITVTANVSLTAQFTAVPYELTLDVEPNGAGTAEDLTNSGPYVAGTPVNLKATPNAGYTFYRWSRDNVSLSLLPEFTYTTRAQVDTVVAEFEVIPPNTYNITANALTGGSASGGGTYGEGDPVTVVATPSAGYVFSGWYEGAIKVSDSVSYTFTASANRTLVAHFTIQRTVTATAGTGGTVSGGGTYTNGSVASLTAVPGGGYVFDGWYSGSTRISSNNPYSFTVTSDVSLEARFVELGGDFEVTVASNGNGTVEGGGVYSTPNKATVKAVPDEGFVFLRWEVDGKAVSGEATYSFPVMADTDLLAVFGPNPKYRCDYRNHHNDLCRIDITFENYSGETILLRAAGDNACVIIRDRPEDPYHPLVYTKAQVTLIQEEHNPIDVRELQEAEDRDFVLSFYIEGDLKFRGFVVPDGIQQIFQAPPYDVVITATDGLSLLAGIVYTHGNLPGGRNPMNYFRRILFHNLGNPLPIRWVNTLKNDAWPLEDDLFTGSLRWAPTGEGFTDYAGNVKNGQYILEHMLASMQCFIFQDEGRWNIWRVNDVVTGQFTYREIPADFEEFDITEYAADVNVSVGGVYDGFDYGFIEEDAYVTSKKALKTVAVVYEHEQRDNILPNGSMDLVNTFTDAPMYWGMVNGETATVRSVPSLYADRGYAVEINNTWPGSEPGIFGLLELPIDTDILYNKFNFSFTFAILDGASVDVDGFIVWESTPFPLRLSYHAGTKVYYLNEFGYWSEVNEWIQLSVPNLKLGDVATIDFRAKQPDIIFPLPDVTPIGQTDEPFISVELGIPENRKIQFDDIAINVEQVNDVYEATSSVAKNTASETYSLKISSSHNGFHVSNFMSGFGEAGVEKFFSDGKLSQATLTEMTAHAIIRNRYKPSVMFESSLYSRNYRFGEIYNVVLLNGKKLLPLKSSWNTETNTVKITAVEVRDDGTGIFVKHYASNDNTKQLYGEQ